MATQKKSPRNNRPPFPQRIVQWQCPHCPKAIAGTQGAVTRNAREHLRGKHAA